MKVYSIAVFISTLFILHTAIAIPSLSLRYLRSSLENVNRYQSRDAVPDPNKMNATPPADIGNDDVAPVKPQRQNDIPQGSVRPEEPIKENMLIPEEGLPDANDNVSSDGVPNVYANDPTGAETIPQAAQATLPTNNVDYPKREDGPAFTDSEFSDDSVPVPPNSISQSPAFQKLKMYAGLTSVLATIARIPQTVALQIDSVMAGLQSTYPINTNVGAYMAGTRFLLRNPRALKPFDLMDQAGLGRLPDLVSSMPSVFLPIINSMDRIWEAIVRRSAIMMQRFAGAVRRVTERASRSLGGVSFARGMDSYSISVPNLIDMVLKGRLANRLDELLGYLQTRFGSGLSSIGSAFSATSNPANDSATAMMGDSVPAKVDPARNQPAYRMRSAPRFSPLRNYYKPSRYYN